MPQLNAAPVCLISPHLVWVAAWALCVVVFQRPSICSYMVFGLIHCLVERTTAAAGAVELRIFAICWREKWPDDRDQVARRSGPGSDGNCEEIFSFMLNWFRKGPTVGGSGPATATTRGRSSGSSNGSAVAARPSRPRSATCRPPGPSRSRAPACPRRTWTSCSGSTATSGGPSPTSYSAQFGDRLPAALSGAVDDLERRLG